MLLCVLFDHYLRCWRRAVPPAAVTVHAAFVVDLSNVAAIAAACISPAAARAISLLMTLFLRLQLLLCC